MKNAKKLHKELIKKSKVGLSGTKLHTKGYLTIKLCAVRAVVFSEHH